MIYEFLANQNIQYQRFDHEAVFTCEEAERVLPQIEGAHTKNFFLRDAKGRRHFLISVPSTKIVDLKQLSVSLGVSNLSFGSPERLLNYLKLEPGSVTILGVINDESASVELVIDEELWSASALLCHPLVNTSTLRISREGLEKFFSATKHVPRIMPIPSRISC